MPNGTVGFVVSDVSGHGFGPALLMASTSTLIRLLAETHTDVGEILARVNRFLAKETDDHFVTLLLGCLDPQSRSFHYASTGIPPVTSLTRRALSRPAWKVPAPPACHFPGLGGVSGCRARSFWHPATSNIVLLTDGIQEEMSPLGEQFGADRTLEVVRTQQTKKAVESWKACIVPSASSLTARNRLMT